MVNLEDIEQAAQITRDERGKPVVQIPLDLWQKWLEQARKPQNERILALLDEWDTNPDDTPAEWWDEFQTFLKVNRLDLS
jgi:alpha-L-arabinofuranosidase